MKPHPDVVIPPGTSKEERAKIYEKARLKRYKLKHPEKHEEWSKRANDKYLKTHPERKEIDSARARAWAIENADLIKERKSTPEWKERSRQYARTHYAKNKEACKISAAKWDAKNQDKIKATNKRYHLRRLKRDPLYAMKEKIRGNVRSSFNRIMKGKPAKTEKLLGCTWVEAREHFEKLFTEGMTWENHGKGPGYWEIDHVRPVAEFREDELHLINHYTNLQPLWYEDHLKKSIKERTHEN